MGSHWTNVFNGKSYKSINNRYQNNGLGCKEDNGSFSAANALTTNASKLTSRIYVTRAAFEMCSPGIACIPLWAWRWRRGTSSENCDRRWCHRWGRWTSPGCKLRWPTWIRKTLPDPTAFRCGFRCSGMLRWRMSCFPNSGWPERKNINTTNLKNTFPA